MQNCFLLIASLGFYAWGEPWFVFVMMGSIIGNWAFGLLVDKYRERMALSKGLIALMLVFNLTVIFIFKYLMFTLENINSLLGIRLTVYDIALPIGISFFTFQAISYVIDVYRGDGLAQKNLLNVGLYISFFPQLIAGPIVRYITIQDQIMNRKETFEDFSGGICRFTVGFGKKILLSNNFALIADSCFKLSHNNDDLTITMAWLGAFAYTLQIYFDFSGYSDMAIGLGKMFGFHFPENFNYPYISKSISEFWRRWHISLGTWFRDYVYFPLGGSRVSTKSRLVFNLFIVWLLTGIWHGANWTFICWGLMYFVFITAEKLTGFEKCACPKVIKHIYTMLFVIIGWVIFRAADIGDAFAYLSTMFGFDGSPFADSKVYSALSENMYFFIFGILFSMPVAKYTAAWIKPRVRDESPLLAAAYCVVFTLI
ncbi:MAG: MBOAT family protein, partial [Anaerovorax sp.]